LRTPVLLGLADTPDVMASDLHLTIALGAREPGAILPAAAADERPGRPALCPADPVGERAHLARDRGARSVLARLAQRVHLVPLGGARAPTDLDTPEERAHSRDRQAR
jgi:CTP:molybdopterin cytidylyltransferase MocA